MSSLRGNLKPAHQGYRYQDIAAAYMMVRSIVERFDAVIVDRKEVADDRIDDLEIRAAGSRVRRQFKSSQDGQRAITQEDFTAKDSSLRIDRLVLTHTRADTPAREYRLCATWQIPDKDDPLSDILEAVAVEPTISNWHSQNFRLRGEFVWPAASDPIWLPLIPYGQPGAEFDRDDFLAFCDLFIVELALPQASTILADPGPLEQGLVDLLSERVGIGRYPNHGRVPADVAALVISLANLGRTQGAMYTPADLERELGIRTDFGRVAQAFPLDESLFHDRPEFRRTIRERALQGVHQLIVAPPGAGKSWELTRLAEELHVSGAIVARHYCYLEPGDELVERRITSDVFFGNVLGELIDAAPDLLGASEARYAAGLPELEAVLAKAATSDRPIVLVVDGLDHIARIRASVRSLADEETDIVERLATLDVPAGVSIVVGSQPGHHLDPLRIRWDSTFSEYELPSWLPSDLSALMVRLGVGRALEASNIVDNDDIERLLAEIAERADGNPLYARYLAREIMVGLSDGTITNIQDWITEAPAIANDIVQYYLHLYRTISAEAQIIADVLGVIDFAVSESELLEMLPALVGDWLPRALVSLAPVITTVAGQGGIRIFHESFRRFMTDELARQGRSPAHALGPVITWLESLGFYENARAYRFLLPALRRAGRDSEVLSRVGTLFVSESVAQAHQMEAIHRNLILASDLAAHACDWPALVRCVELHRSTITCFDGAQNTWHHYWIAYLEMFGAPVLSERLLFDGRPTLSRGDGLFVCALIDNAGGNAPWREYLELPEEASSDSSTGQDEDNSLTREEATVLVTVQGRLRVGKSLHVLGGLMAYLRECGDDFKPLFIRTLSGRIARVLGPQLIDRLASRSDMNRRGGPCMTLRAATVLRLGAADEYVRLGDQSKAIEISTLALEGADTAELVLACIEHGAKAGSTTRIIAVDPTSIPIGVGPDRRFDDARNLRAWVTAVRLAAHDPVRSAEVLQAERRRIDGIGWYRCWLRFVIGLAEVEHARRSGGAGDIVAAFNELTYDMNPFSGEPRACDLYRIESLIRETITLGLSLVRTEAEWQVAIEAISDASTKTASRIDREDGGPIPTGVLIELLAEYIQHPIGGVLVRDLIERRVKDWDTIATYYSTHAEFAMHLARARKASGNSALAQDAWKQAAAYLTGYGWRKDITLFDIIDSVSVLLAVSQMAALRALVDTQALINAVVVHTDGRSTNHAPNAWFKSLLSVHPVAAIALLARTITEEDDDGGWPNVRAIEDVAACVGGLADAALLDAVLSTLLFEVKAESESAETANARLAPVVHLATVNRLMASRAIRQVAAEVVDDGGRHTKGAAQRVESLALELGLLIPRIAMDSELADAQSSPAAPAHNRRFKLLSLNQTSPTFPANPTFIDLLVGLRTNSRKNHRDDPNAWNGTIHSLSYHLTGLIDDGRVDDARRLLRFFARDVYISASREEHPLARLATTLDTSGYSHIAAVAYALAYTATRGGGGYLRFGDHSHSHLIMRSMALDADAAKQILADEIAYSLRGNWYDVGISKHLVGRIAEWGEADIAESAWREAFAVVKHRLPLAPTFGWFSPLVLDAIPDWTVDESLIALLLSRLSDPKLVRKNAALAGVVRAIQCRPDAVAKPLRWWLTRNAHVSSVLLVLDALLAVEPEPYVVSRTLQDVLAAYVRSSLWGARRLAELLLNRASCTIPSSSAVSPDTLNGSRPTTQQLAALAHADVGKTLGKLASLWPELPNRVFARLHRMLDGVDRHRERIRDCYRLMYGRNNDSVPATPVLLWQRELFQAALHDELTGLNAHLWSRGEWDPDIEDEVLSVVLPHIGLHLGLRASRTVRPDWPKPNSQIEGIGVLPILGDDDPEFIGWRRLAMVERQYVSRSDRSFDLPTEYVTVLAGAIAVPFGTTIPVGALPFEDGDVDDWWWSDVPLPTFPLHLQRTRLVKLTRVTEWLGDALVLIPPLELRSYLQLEAPEFGAPLIWYDRSGMPAIVLRTWRVRNARIISVGAEPAEYEGSDLIVRPDVFERVESLCHVPVRELRTVWRESLSDSESA